MKITMFVTENEMQFNLTPESAHEKEFVKVLSEYKQGTVAIRQGADIGKCQGGWLKGYADSEVAAITITKGDS